MIIAQNSVLSGKTLLVVDDEQELRQAIVNVFERAGCIVLEAASGNEALALARVRKVDAVLSDVRMPNGDGVHLLEELRKIHPDIPVVLLLTGFADISESDAIEKGADGLLHKPVSRKVLLEALERLLT